MKTETTLYRAVGLNEARDIEACGGFRPHQGRSLEEGKWFATTYDDAVTWGRRMPPAPHHRPFRIASARVPEEMLASIEARAHLDRIGPAYFVRVEQLPALNAAGAIVVESLVYESEAGDEPIDRAVRSL